MMERVGRVMIRNMAAAWRRDRYTALHSKAVAKLAAKIGQALELDCRELERLRLAGLLHDIGKLAIPRHVLYNRGQLSHEEWALITSHPVTGAWLLEMARADERVVQAVRQHHERLDGSGYPAGLTGSETCFLAQIVAVADVYCAMTEDRPYRQQLPAAEALRVLDNGDAFNQAVVRALGDVLTAIPWRT